MSATLERIKSLSQSGKKLEAIKMLRDEYGIGLKQSKELIEGISDESIPIDHAEKILTKFKKSGTSRAQDDTARNQVKKKTTLIKKPKKDYSKLIILIISSLILIYFFFIHK